MARKLCAFVLAAAVAATGAVAAESTAATSAQQKADQAPARPRRTVIHFGEEDIRGDITRPDGELVQAPRRVAEGSLLRIRRSFIDRALSGAVRGE
jgi:polyisoprenoid-binding protein YceI